jgi:ferric iron reductase protein FhuF
MPTSKPVVNHSTPARLHSRKDHGSEFRLLPGLPVPADPATPDVAVLKGTELLDRDRLKSLIDSMAAHLQASHPIVGASLFVKSYARTFTGAWKIISFSHALPQLSLDQVMISVNPVWTVSLHYKDEQMLELPENGLERDRQIAEWRQTLIQTNLTPLFDRLTELTGLSQAVAWENCLIYWHHFYKQWIKEATSLEERARLEQDYAIVTAAGTPLHIPANEIGHPVDPEEKIRIRRTCCLKYALPSGSHCYTCPSLCDSKRTEIILHKAAR